MNKDSVREGEYHDSRQTSMRVCAKTKITMGIKKHTQIHTHTYGREDVNIM